MVFGLHREPLLLRVVRRAFGHGPALQDAIKLEAEVVVEAFGGVLLNAETDRPRAPARLREAQVSS